MVRKWSFFEKLVYTVSYLGLISFIFIVYLELDTFSFFKAIVDKKTLIQNLAPLGLFFFYYWFIRRILQFEWIEEEKKRRAILYLLFLFVVHFLFYIWKQDDLFREEHNYEVMSND